MQERKSMQLKFCSYYTTLPLVVGYLNLFKKNPVNTTQVKMEGYLKKFKNKKNTTLQLGVEWYNKDKIFVTF